MIVKLPTEYHLECLSLKGGCRGSSESTHAKMQHFWKSHALAQMILACSRSNRLANVSKAEHAGQNLIRQSRRQAFL